MSKKAAAADAERAATVLALRKLLKPGDTVYCILRRVSSSGMLRVIDLCIPYKPRGRALTLLNIGWQAATVCNMPWDRDRYGAKVGGCGMDMGFHFVYSLSDALYGSGHPKGYACIGERCLSNSHTNGLRETCPVCGGADTGETVCPRCRGYGDIRTEAPRGKGVWHKDGYALKSSWL